MTSLPTTVDDAANSSLGLQGTTAEPHLFLVLECDRLGAGGARYSMTGLRGVAIGRGEERRARRVPQEDGTWLRLEVPSPSMSSRHARLSLHGDQWVLEDLGSRNGTRVNGLPISSTALRDGDTFDMGRVHFILRTSLPTPTETSMELDSSATLSFEPGLATLIPREHQRTLELRRIARSSVPVLLRGETGTGKELAAKALHAMSGRTGQFVAVNCGALSPFLTEGLLFGHVRGSFSGAHRDSLGFVRAAEGGTLFLDEIGDLPVAAQAALLRLFEEGEVVAVGAIKPMKVDVRIVAATHKAIETGEPTFRVDLLARLAAYTHILCPLRDRREDLGLLVSTILRSLEGEVPTVRGMIPEVVRAFLRHEWPMNIRELKRLLKVSSLLANDGMIDEASLPNASLGSPHVQSTLPTGLRDEMASRPSLNADELRLKTTLISHLRQCNGNVTSVARMMGKGPTQIRRWLQRFEVASEDYRAKMKAGP